MLSERIPHDEGCNSIYEPWKEPNECDCYVAEVAKLERVARAAKAIFGVEGMKNLRPLYEELEAALADADGLY